MAGINRLGKGSAKPGTLRPTDPNRFKTEDFFSVDAEADPEYLRRVVEVEQLTAHKAGCIQGRGAFDRDDALYLRDEAEKARHRELALRDTELGKFTRVQLEQDATASFDTGGAAGPAIKRAKLVKRAKAVKRQPGAQSAIARPAEAGHREEHHRRAGSEAQSASEPAQSAGAANKAGNEVDRSGGEPSQHRGPHRRPSHAPPAGLGLGYISSSGSSSDSDSDT